jgi:phosphodiesterase/alkaline phosphatase D-like protein
MGTSNRRKLCFVSVLGNQRFMSVVILIFLLGWAAFYFSNATLSNAQTNSKANITTPTNFAITHGIASDDVTNHSVTIWSRSNKNPVMNVWYDTNPIKTNR